MKFILNRTIAILDFINYPLIYLCIALAVIIPTALRIPIDINITETATAFYRVIDDVPAGATILLSFDYTPSTEIELSPIGEAVIRHCFHNNVNVLAMCLHPEGSAISRKILKKIVLDFPHKIYGRDYVNLGFKEGEEAVLVNMGKSFRDPYPTDMYGTPLDSLELMTTIINFHQIYLILDLSTGKPGLKEWIQQVQAKHNVILVGGVTAVHGVEFQPYLQSGQVRALLAGITDAAQYEQLLIQRQGAEYGVATLAMSAQAVAHVVMVLLIILGNVVFFLKKYQQSGDDK